MGMRTSGHVVLRGSIKERSLSVVLKRSKTRESERERESSHGASHRARRKTKRYFYISKTIQ
ncbi:UNVERIFIED_CONTAM: hypothetical protein FKN15_036820 [Acipenser sinensis]